MARLDDGAPFEHEKYYTGANNVNSLQGNQGKFTPDYYAQAQDAIGIIRSRSAAEKPLLVYLIMQG